MDILSQPPSDLRDRLHTKASIAEDLYLGLKQYFGFSGITIFLLDPSTSEVDVQYPEKEGWTLPIGERDWIISRYKDLMIHTKPDTLDHLYVQDRSKFLHADKFQLRDDQKLHTYHCSDGLYLILISEDEFILGIVFLNNWDRKEPVVTDEQEIQDLVDNIRVFVSDHVLALDNLFIHEKIEGLLSDKKELKQRIQKDEDDLRRRILELSVLYDTSNALGYTLDYRQIVSLGMDALFKVLHFDVCSILLMDFVQEGEVITRVNRPVKEEFLKEVQNNVISVALPFLKGNIDSKGVRRTLESNFTTTTRFVDSQKMSSFANVPLVFKEDIIGMLNVCSTSKNVFSRSEMTFLHTMANQLSSHLGRLKTVKQLERTKISSLIKSMTEGVVMFDENQSLDIINPMAVELLGLDTVQDISREVVISKFYDVGLGGFYEQTLKNREKAYTKEVMIKNRAISVKTSPVFDVDQQQIGHVFMLRDFTEFQNMNRLKTQRLEVISKVNLIIKSISDLDNLLTVLMEFILTIANADMGSIQLKQGRAYHTIVHSNFPDKIRRSYKFKSGGTISEYVAQSKEPYFIQNYRLDEKVNQNNKVILDSYICIPILVKNNLIGIINIARRAEPGLSPLTRDDLDTLVTITNLSGTAIYNALLYQETMKRQRIDQELKVANDIQTRLLPENVPELLNADFGAVSIPAREVGGDFYDFLPLENGHIGILVADIVGKGVPAGLFMAMLKSMVHTHLLSVFSAKDALDKINTILCNDPVIDRFIPVFYAILDPETLLLRYCNAGHEPAIIQRGGEFNELDTPGLPLGADEEAGYEEGHLQLQADDTVLLFTDGIVEAKNADGQLFGSEKLKSLVLESSGLTCEALNQKVVDSVQDFCGTQEQGDDITLVTLRAEFNRVLPTDEAPLRIKKITVLSAKKNIKRIRKEVEEIAKAMGFPPADIFNLKLALNEAHANVIEHAYFGKENGEIVFRFLEYKDRLTIVIKDFGPGMGQRTIKGKAEHLDELEGSGLGVFLINTVMDKIEYNRIAKIGTELVLTKYLPKSTEKE